VTSGTRAQNVQFGRGTDHQPAESDAAPIGGSACFMTP